MDLNALVDKLRLFSLIENEARVYLTLATKGPLRPSEIAESSSVARAEVHRHLRSLEKKGFCMVVADKAKKYSAIDPGEALTSIVEQEEIKRDIMINRKNGIISEWNASQKPRNSVEMEPEKLQVLRDVQIAVERGLKMVFDAKKICRIILRRGTLEQYISTDIVQKIASSRFVEKIAEKRNVMFRILLVSRSPEIGSLREIIEKTTPPSNLEVKWASSPMLEVLPDAVIADEDEMLVHTPQSPRNENGFPKERISKAVFTNVSSMIDSFIVSFDEHWKNAANFNSHRIPQNY